MSLSVNQVAFTGVQTAGTVSNTGAVNKTAQNDLSLNKRCLNADTVSFKGKEMSDDEKKELVLKARTSASGWAFWLGPFSTLYYGLRSDEKVAKQYDLDPEADKKLVKKIKTEQLLWTLPGCIPGLGIVPGGAAYLYNKNCDSDKIEL